MRTLHKTGALCPTCLKELPAEVYADDEGVVWMTRTCPEHGKLDTRMWPSAVHYGWWLSEAFEKAKPQNTKPQNKQRQHPLRRTASKREPPSLTISRLRKVSASMRSLAISTLPRVKPKCSKSTAYGAEAP